MAAAGAVIALGAAGILLAEERVERVGSTPQAEIWAVGDADPPRSERVADLLRRHEPDRILYLGDVYPRGSRADFRRWAKPFGSLVELMAPTAGNHEWGKRREGYLPFWTKVLGEAPRNHYAFEAAGWQILSVNSERADQAAERSWLRRKVKSGGNCRIAFWHRPRFSVGKKPGSDVARGLWDALGGGARIVVNGHDHNSQRFRPIDGMAEFVSGHGGRALYPIERSHPKLAFSDDTRFGALRLLLSPRRADWSFVSARGRVLDAGTLSCRE